MVLPLVSMFLPLQLIKSIVCCPAKSMLKNCYYRRPCSFIGKGYHSVNCPPIDDPQPYSFVNASVKHLNLTKDWEKERKDKLTPSIFGGAIGFWKNRRSKLWLEKIGAKEPFASNLATKWTKNNEKEAINRYMLITGNKVCKPHFQHYQTKDKPENENWLGASPDGLIVESIDGLKLKGVLEIKCPYFDSGSRKSRTSPTPWKRIPPYYIPQAQGLMEILDCDWMDFYVWVYGNHVTGSSIIRLHRDVEYWNLLKKALSDFWLNHVQPAKFEFEIRAISNHRARAELISYMPTPKHELCTAIFDKSMQIVDRSELLSYEIDGDFRRNEYYV